MPKASNSAPDTRGPDSATPLPASGGRSHDHGLFPVVGLGASAGGLEALEHFLAHVQPGSGMAFVVIQHLDPTHKGFMPELLQRHTAMRVMEAGNHMQVEPDCVYIIPPNKDLALRHGTFYLSVPAEPRGRRLPIDFFFRTLAQDRRDRAVAVILSGMGSDGTLGLRTVKEYSGLSLAQDPRSAKFDSMPRSALDAGLVDMVGQPQELPAKILAYVRRMPAAGAGRQKTPAQKSALDEVLMLLMSHTGNDFSLYKKSTVCRRIERRMGIHQLPRMADYVRYLKENPQEVDLLFKELLIGVTNFFRDPQSWACLQEEVLPGLLADNPAGKAMRAWVAGCSTGEEAYSLAILFKETLEQLNLKGRFSLQIFATDLDPDAIERARQGFYPPNIAGDLSPERLARFFVEDNGGYRICKEIREMVIFAPQNLIMDPPFTRLDILTCRNLLIYLGPELQRQLLPLFQYSLNPGGILFLGSSESIGAFTNLFTPIGGKSRIFRRGDVLPAAGTVQFPSRFDPAPHPAPAAPAESRETDMTLNLQSLADNLLLQRFSPAAVLVNSEGDIVYISGRTGKYLEPAAGKANWNIYAMARDGLNHELAMVLPMALRGKETLVRRNVRVGSDGDARFIDLTVHPIEEPASLRGMTMVVFTDVAAVPPESADAAEAGKGWTAPGSREAELEQALRHAQEEAQTARQEMQRSREELQAANEELQATNEELQSTNEELTSSKEEMQSMNEELQTLNSELQSKVDELSAASNDMKNLLNSTEIATVFLDSRLHVRRFTKQATRIFRLIPGDTGRPLSDIATDLASPRLEEDAWEVLHTLVFCEKEIATVDGRWFMMRILPYRTLDNVIDGVVITFNDISVAKRLEAELRGFAATEPETEAGKEIP